MLGTASLARDMWILQEVVAQPFLFHLMQYQSPTLWTIGSTEPPVSTTIVRMYHSMLLQGRLLQDRSLSLIMLCKWKMRGWL